MIRNLISRRLAECEDMLLGAPCRLVPKEEKAGSKSTQYADLLWRMYILDMRRSIYDLAWESCEEML